MTTFYHKLSAIWNKYNSLLCVGLDSDIAKLPAAIKKRKNPQFVFNKVVIDATHDLVCAYKPNCAFYEARGVQGMRELKMTCDYLRKTYPDIVLILDAKRADIGNTNTGYISFIFDYLGADAVTLHPYLGRDALQPFLDRKEKGNIILCRTSNPGSAEIQDLKTVGEPLFQVIAKRVSKYWNTNNNCALVVGATYPKELKAIRQIVRNMPILVPGIGMQGGDIERTVKAGKDELGAGMIINASRSVIFASNPREEAITLRDQINFYRKRAR